MELQTLLQILFANGHEKIVAHAVKIDSGIERPLPEKILCQIHKTDLKEDYQFEQDRSHGHVECKVIHFDKYKLEDEYTIELPNGKFKQVSDRTGRDSETKIISRLA